MDKFNCEICEKNRIKYKVLDIDKQIKSGKLGLEEIFRIMIKEVRTQKFKKNLRLIQVFF